MDTEKRPVLTGLLALVGVAVVVGLLGGLAVMVGVQATGIGGTSSSSSGEEAPATFNLPRPSDTGTTEPAPEEPSEPTEEEPTSEAPAEAISLTSSRQSVSPMQQIDLTGTYQAGEGSILQVQRFEDGAWVDFYIRNATVFCKQLNQRSFVDNFLIENNFLQILFNLFHFT